MQLATSLIAAAQVGWVAVQVTEAVCPRILNVSDAENEHSVGKAILAPVRGDVLLDGFLPAAWAEMPDNRTNVSRDTEIFFIPESFKRLVEMNEWDTQVWNDPRQTYHDREAL